VEGVSLTASDFNDGGGYLVDPSAGIAVLVTDGTFARGQLLRVTGTVDDRYAQRTIRATADSIASLGVGNAPLPLDTTTGSIGEGVEGRLVEVSGIITSAATTLSSGIAWDLDDGTGASRVLIGNATGIDTSSWARGVGLTLIGVVGQRDSSGTGTSGFRIQPRGCCGRPLGRADRDAFCQPHPGAERHAGGVGEFVAHADLLRSTRHDQRSAGRGDRHPPPRPGRGDGTVGTDRGRQCCRAGRNGGDPDPDRD